MAKSEDGSRGPDWRSSLSELDTWVMEEEAAVTRRSRAHAQPQPKTHGDTTRRDDRVIDARQWPRHPESEAQKSSPPAHATGEAEVVGLGRDGAPLKPAEGLFTAEEEAFIAQFAAWLRGRPNSDVILEEVWHLAVGDDIENPDDGETSDDREDETEDSPADDTARATGRPRNGAPEADKT